MENFLIGHHNCFDEDKQARDYRESFWGVEACLMKSEEDVQLLHKYKTEKQFNIGIHFPLRAGQWNHRDPQYLSNCNEIRNQSYNYMSAEIEYAKQIDPNYILLHYPKPVILDERVDWHGRQWRFGDESEYFFESECDIDTFRKRSEDFFEWFSLKATENNFIPVIELDAIPTYIYETDMLIQLLEKYPNIRLCMDIGRLHLQHMIDENFNSFKFLESVVHYVSEIHLWNIQVADKLYNSHHPALPTLEPSKGWADIEKYFAILSKANTKHKILFEHRSDVISDSELEECYEWIFSMCNK